MKDNMLTMNRIENDLHVPEVSIIIPIYKQWEFLPSLLNALGTQDFSLQKYGEVLLIDNDTDSDFLRPSLPSWIKLVPCHAPGSYAARNLGATLAKGKLLVFTDADCKPQSNWLSAMISAYKSQSGDNESILAGPVNIPLVDSASIWQKFDAVRGIPQANFIKRGYAATANLAVPRTIFDNLSGFDPQRFSGGDADFCRRARKLGYFLRLVPDAVVDHPARANFQDLALKARRIKGGQITSGRLINKIFWLFRSLFPPIRETIIYLRSEYDINTRFAAIAVRFLLWPVELHEVCRLIFRYSPPERR